MQSFNSLLQRVISVDNNSFEQTAIELFNFQASQNLVFKNYLASLGHSGKAQNLRDIVFLPIELFKNHTIKTQNWQEETYFESSGTTGMATSRHAVRDLSLYNEMAAKHFEQIYGPLSQYVILGLLPSYLERGNSGLIAMVDHFMDRASAVRSKSENYFLHNFENLFDVLKELKEQGHKTILWGVTFALLDFAEAFQFDFPDLIIMETGGMKGRKQEMVRAEVHALLQQSFGVEAVHSEYGMTELSSQAYAKKEGVFVPAQTMKVLARDINDPFSLVKTGKTGALNVIDLGNIHTCAFIETKDLGTVQSDGTFTVMGRMDNSDIRGCNLLVT